MNKSYFLLQGLVNKIAQRIHQSFKLEEILATTVEETREFLQVDRVLIYRIWDDGTGSAITENVKSPYPEILGQTFPEEVFPQQYHQEYIEGKTLAVHNVEKSHIRQCLFHFIQQFGVKAKLVVPIIQEIRKKNFNVNSSSSEQKLDIETTPYLWGLLIAHQCSKVRIWNEKEIELVKQLATQVAIAIKQAELHTQLQQLNRELEERVKKRTEELALSNESLKAEIIERQRTEIALRHTNQTLESLISASPRAIFTLDLEDKVKIWNPAAEQIFGWKAEEVIDRVNPAISKNNLEKYQIIKENILKNITPSSIEIKQQKKDGSIIDIVFSAAPITNTEGKINGIVAVVADITEQKKQAEQVRLLQSVVINTNDSIIITKADTIDEPGPEIIYVNEAFTKMTGYTLEEVLGKTPRLLQGEKTNRVELDKVRNALSQWQPVTVEVINYRKDGSEFWSQFSVVPVVSQNNTITHWISVHRETTERKKNEEALRLSEERFRQVVENALDMITIVDRNGKIYYQSPSVETVLGYTTTQFIEKNFFDYIYPDDKKNIQTSVINSIQNTLKVINPVEFRCQHHSGGWRNLEAITQQFIDNVPTAKIVITSRDISERKRLEEVRIALEREKELNIVKTRFFSMASHEFRTPLSTVLAAAQVLENASANSENPEKQLRNLYRIQNSVKNMVQLLDDILTINRAETGNLEFNPKPLALETFCRQFIEEIKLSTGTEHQLEFFCKGKRINPSLDEKLLRSILANLLSNAIKYSPQGDKIHLYLKFYSKYIEIQVQDSGFGISPEDQTEIFEPFYRGLNVRHLTGTGLGLVVVKKCVDLHGGNINLESAIDRGTTVTVTLPVTMES
ncbi:PAS domain S-box protein [Geminocystis sp. NIES-3709]|uniref:sensor histidine kinase n=1 Tax=Geminocystis sp. NIES-3709 TaxID=1617448 RepID=UPI0005FCCD1C|nr:PAS domain S-box protein [Geminocystis sp. NIES-3709]BAQ65920.1 two-component sensor histidine kinase [Geminocystis sp. NIES-3709]